MLKGSKCFMFKMSVIPSVIVDTFSESGPNCINVGPVGAEVSGSLQ